MTHCEWQYFYPTDWRYGIPSLPLFAHILCRGTAYKRFDPNTPVLVQGALKLAMKYECDALRHRIVSSLEADWPQTLAQWDARRAEAVLLRSEHSLQLTGRVNGLYLDDRLPEPASAIRLASDYGIPSILPAAFYTLAI